MDKARKSVNAQGFKIALDLLLKANIPNEGVAEIPFSFGVRSEGESKLTGKVMYLYLEQLAELYLFQYGAFGLTLIAITILFIAWRLLRIIF
jgi:dolichol-phosphate mannosyltransferase